MRVSRVSLKTGIMIAVTVVSRRMRGVAVVLFLCALVCAQALSLGAAHNHNTSEHCCALCHVGPLPFAQPTIPAGYSPFIALEWLAWVPEFHVAHDVQCRSTASRAPPLTLPV